MTYPPPPPGHNQIIEVQPGGATAMTPQAPPLAFPNDYNSGLCGCFSDCRACLDGWCCNYCDVGFQSGKLMSGRGGNMDCGVCCGLCCCDIFCCKGLAISSYVGCKQRPDVNQAFGIQESCCCACMKGFCCTPCSTCQTHREMNMRLYGPGGVCSTVVHVGPALTAANPYPQQPQAFPPVMGEPQYPNQQGQPAEGKTL